MQKSNDDLNKAKTKASVQSSCSILNYTPLEPTDILSNVGPHTRS